MPASLTQVSIRPKCSTAACASRWTCGHSATSVATARALPPDRSISAATSFSAASSRPASTTLAPLRPIRIAASRPNPDEAPVMTTVCSSKGRGMSPPMIRGRFNVPGPIGPDFSGMDVKIILQVLGR